MSKVECLSGIVACMMKANDFLGKDCRWIEKNKDQWQFLHGFFEKLKSATSIPEMESIISRSAEEINAFLAERGFSITLDPFQGDEFGVASVLDLLVKWQEKGERTKVLDIYDAVMLKSVQGASVRRIHESDSYVVTVDTQGDDKVHMMMVDDNLLDVPMSLTQLALDMTKKGEPDFYEKVIFPMIDLNVMTDINWLLGMVAVDEDGSDWAVSQAKQQNKLRLNEFGARAQSATAMGMLRGMAVPPTVFTIDKPFLIWFTRSGIEMPLFVAHVTEEDWKDPGDLETV
jgi:hypothetical protein